MLDEAINYPRRREDWVKQVLIGGVVTLLVVPIFLAIGYYVRILRDSYQGSDNPPAFDEWGDLAVTGILAMVIGFIYFLVPMAIFLGLGGVGVVTGSPEALLASMLTAVAASGAVGIVFGYVFPAAIANFARNGSVGDAFAFGTIKDVVLTKDYAVAWLMAFLVVLSATVVTSVLSIIPVLGWIVAPFVMFYANVAAYRLYGRGYADALGTGGRDETATGAEIPA